MTYFYNSFHHKLNFYATTTEYCRLGGIEVNCKQGMAFPRKIIEISNIPSNLQLEESFPKGI